MANINNGGGTHSCRQSDIAVHLLSWCESRAISIRALHLAGLQTNLADFESRRAPDKSDWQWDPSVFSRQSALWRVDFDLFAFPWNAQLPSFSSWLPQPGASAVTAFSLSWSHLRDFPPFALIPRCLSKIQREAVEVVLISPFWPRQSSVLLLDLSVDTPRLLPLNTDILLSCSCQPHPLMSTGKLRLIAWKLSGRASAARVYQNKLSGSCLRATGTPRTKLINQHGLVCAADVFNGRLIPYMPL